MWDIPMFVGRGYAVYNGSRLKSGEFEEIVARRPHDIEKIKLKDGTPVWIVDEYESWLEYRAQMKNK